MEGLGTHTNVSPWWQRAGIGCALVIVALLAVLVWGMVSQKKLIALGLRATERRVLQHLPREVPDVDRRRLEHNFQCVANAAADGRLSAEEVGRLGTLCRDALRDQTVTAAEAKQINVVASMLCATAGGSPAP